MKLLFAIRRLRRVRFHVLERCLKLLLELALERRRFVLAEHDPPRAVPFCRASRIEGRRSILRVEIRLGERRLVAFVVAVAAVAIHVDDDVAAELLAEIERQLGDEHDRERVVAVHVEDRRLDHLRDVGGIHRRARVGRQGGEADLVVHDDVDGAAGAIARELRHVQRLSNDPLPGEGGVAVDQQRQDFAPMFGVAADALPRARRPFHDRIDRLEMARIGRETNLHFRAASELPHRAIAEVILHVAIAGRPGSGT